MKILKKIAISDIKKNYFAILCVLYFSGKCISLDFNVCSSFYNATSFPNFYKHKTYADAVTYFQNDLQPVIDSGCSSLTSLFLCGLNFPSCNKARQLLPCRSVCQRKYN